MIELRLGMKIVAILSTLFGISWVVNAATLITFGPSKKDGFLWAFMVINILASLPQLANPYYQLKWLISDNVNTRMGLKVGFRYQIIATFIAGGVYVVSAFSILRAPFHVYLLQ